MRPPRSVSVLIPTFQGAPLLGRVLDALADQVCDLRWDLWIVDSGSTDGTPELVQRRRDGFPVPLELRRIHPDEFDHGDTRNLLAALSDGELLVFLTQDAVPRGPRWLADLAANFDDPAVAAAYCRNVPRPDAPALVRSFCAIDPGYAAGRREVRLPPPAEYARLSPHEKRLLYDFNDVASALRRELWQRHPFPRTSFGEDLLMARALLEAGFTIVYDDRAEVEHSHDYGPRELHARGLVDGRFNAEWLDRVCVRRRGEIGVLVRRQLERDRAALEAEGLSGAALERELERARELRRASYRGLWEGGRSRRRRERTRVLDDAALKILYVVHGFPPDTWAGTEVYTLGLAREIARRGHACVVLARAPAELAEDEGGPPEFQLTRGELDGLPVWRMVHRIEHQSLAESYRHPRAEQVFREVLQRERPDVVHFQHLLHFSAELPRIAAALGVPTVITCNDYWALCARVQLVRPDGMRCPRNQGLGCLWCVKQKRYGAIPAARRLAPLVRLAVEAVLRPLARLPELPSVKVERVLRKRRVPLRRWVRAYDELRARQPTVEGGYAAADLLIAPSRFLRGRHLATGRFDPERFVHSDYGMRTDHVAALAKEPDPGGRVRVGYVGSLVWWKGVDVLLRAMALLADEPLTLDVFGPFRPDAEAHHAELARLAGSNVTFRGPFDNDRLGDVYRGVDVQVVPSVWYENSPITIHEAFLTRTPVVVSDIGGMAELVRDGVDGLHFRAGDPADLARALRRFAREPGLAAELAAGAPRVKTLEENAREVEAWYRRLACRVRGPGSALRPPAGLPARRAIH